RGDTTLDYYANAVWPDRLPLLVQTALLDSFQDSGRIRAVSLEQDALHADYTLDVDVRDFSAHYAGADDAPRIQVELICQMALAHRGGQFHRQPVGAGLRQFGAGGCGSHGRGAGRRPGPDHPVGACHAGAPGQSLTGPSLTLRAFVAFAGPCGARNRVALRCR